MIKEKTENKYHCGSCGEEFTSTSKVIFENFIYCSDCTQLEAWIKKGFEQQQRDTIADKLGLKVLIPLSGTANGKSELFCDEIIYTREREPKHLNDATTRYVPYFDHDLVFYLNDILIYEVLLPNGEKDKDFPNISEALKSVNIEVQKKVKAESTITKEQFESYEKIRKSGKTNMWDAAEVSKLSGLTGEEVIEIINSYSSLGKKYLSREEAKPLFKLLKKLGMD